MCTQLGESQVWERNIHHHDHDGSMYYLTTRWHCTVRLCTNAPGCLRPGSWGSVLNRPSNRPFLGVMVPTNYKQGAETAEWDL